VGLRLSSAEVKFPAAAQCPPARFPADAPPVFSGHVGNPGGALAERAIRKNFGRINDPVKRL
jgi:hypothetical protein